MDKRTSMGVIGNMAAYTQFQTANSIPDAAKNPGGGGLAGAGAGLAMGINMANAMSQGLHDQQTMAPPGPPPLQKKTSYYVAINNQQAGPFEVSALNDKVAAGNITRDTLVWTNGMAQWTPAGSVAELSGLFQDAPPPLPPRG